MNAKEKLADLQRQFGLYAQANPEVMNGFGTLALNLFDQYTAAE